MAIERLDSGFECPSLSIRIKLDTKDSNDGSQLLATEMIDTLTSCKGRSVACFPGLIFI